MDDWIIRMIEAGGYWGIVFLMALENIIPPIPSELIMGVGGIAVARGSMEFLPLLVAGTFGSVAGNYAWFVAGDRLGYERLKPMIDRWGRWLTVSWNEVERASDFFRSHGHWVVFFLRFSPFLRTIISLPAGLTHMPLWKFLAFTTAGSVVWNTLLIKGGQWLGGQFSEAQAWLGWMTLGGLGLVLAAYLWRVIRWQPKD